MSNPLSNYSLSRDGVLSLGPVAQSAAIKVGIAISSSTMSPSVSLVFEMY